MSEHAAMLSKNTKPLPPLFQGRFADGFDGFDGFEGLMALMALMALMNVTSWKMPGNICV